MSKEKISKYLLSSCNKALKQKVESFIFDEKEVEFSKAELNKIKFYNHSLFSELDIFNKNRTLKKSEDSNIIKRLLTLGYRYCPEKLISEFFSYPFNYKLTLYKSLDISEEFLIKDLEYTFANCKNSSFFYPIIEELNKKFPNFIDNYLSSKNLTKNNYILAKIFELRFNTKEEKNTQEIDEFILNSLCELYSTERIKNILTFDFKTPELAKNLKDTPISNNDDKLVYFLQNFYITLNIQSEYSEIILGILEILTFSNSLDLLEISTPKEYFDRVNNSHLPFIYKVVYLYKGSEGYDISSYLKDFILDNKNSSIEVLERMLVQNIELGSLILGILINTQEILSQKEHFINSYLNQVKSLILILKEKQEKELGVELINTLGYMLNYCEVEKYINELSNFYDKKNWDINEFINLIAHYERLAQNNQNRNPWEILAKNSSISKKFLIIGTIDFVNISSKAQFTKFLKDNENIFYEVLSKKSFIDFAFEEIMDLTYRSSISFDVTKLLPYLSISDELLLNSLFKILKDKEKECSEEIEKLSKVKNKKIQANIEALKKIWESNRGKDFKDISQLEEYIFSIFDNYKKEVPYPKLECYSQVRENTSENFVDERVIKFYTALYLKNNSNDDIELGKIIRKFINLNDLNRCLDNLLDTWIKDNYPQHSISIIKVFTLTTDSYGIEKVLNLVENCLIRKKIDLAENIFSNLCSIKRKYITSELKYIKAGIYNQHLGNNLSLDEEDEFEILSTPDLDFSMGFDRDGKKTLNYGNREITLSLNKNLDLNIYNQEGKEMKALPKYSAKLEDDEKRVNFYLSEFKRYKKKKEFLISELQKHMFYQMIGDRSWTITEWRDEISNSYFSNVISENILWEVVTDEKTYLCRYSNNDFIDIETEKNITDYQKIKIFYSGEIDISKKIEIEKKVKDIFTPFLPQQFSITKVSNSSLDSYSKVTLVNKKVNLSFNTFYTELFIDSFFYQDRFISFDKLNKILINLNLIQNSKYYYIQDINFKSLIDENIKIEKINPRFLNFVFFLLDFITKD